MIEASGPWCVLERDDELYTLYGPYGSEDAARVDADLIADDFETETLVLPMNPPALSQPVDVRLEV